MFRYLPEPHRSDVDIDEANCFIRKSLFRSGEAVVAGTKVNGKQYLKFTLLNPATTIQDIQAILKLIMQHGQAFTANHAVEERAPEARGVDVKVGVAV